MITHVKTFDNTWFKTFDLKQKKNTESIERRLNIKLFKHSNYHTKIMRKIRFRSSFNVCFLNLPSENKLEGCSKNMRSENMQKILG